METPICDGTAFVDIGVVVVGVGGAVVAIVFVVDFNPNDEQQNNKKPNIFYVK